MAMEENAHDVEAITALIARQFAALSWDDERKPDWRGFAADFLPEAMLFASARPAKGQSVETFVSRMKHLAQTSLSDFRETPIGMRIHVFGHVAIAVAGVEMVENDAELNRNVEMMLLVKTDGRWRIAAQAWDRATPEREIPDGLLLPAK